MTHILKETEIERAKHAIDNAQIIAIIPHRGPDGDAVGSAVALKLTLDKQNKSTQIVCIDPPPKNTLFLPHTNDFKNQLDPKNYDLLIFVDNGAHYMSRFHETIPDLFSNNDCINIDHHESNDNFAKINLVDSKAASTTQILFKLFTKWGYEIDSQIATCLLTGLYFDTGSFKHPNTSPSVLKIAGQLNAKGADSEEISKQLFKCNSVNKLKLWGRILEKSRVTHKSITTSVAKLKDYEEFKANSKDLEGVIDYLNAVPESKFCVLLSEDQKGGVKGSLRTQNENVDLSSIAEIFGGGGHKMASGFRIEGQIQEEKHWSIK